MKSLKKMTEENKLLESDTDDIILDDDFLDIEEDQEDDDVQVGAPKNVDATKEFLTKEQLQRITGRQDIDTIEAFEKHYKNLSSYVGKKVEPAVEKKTQPAPRKSEDTALTEILETQKRIEFFMENPDAKKHFSEYVKPMADGSGISYVDAWEKVKPLVLSSEEQEKEREIGVNSKNRIKTVDNSQLKGLAEKARSGSAEAQEALVAKMLGLEK